jgi:hypothetical protein
MTRAQTLGQSARMGGQDILVGVLGAPTFREGFASEVPQLVMWPWLNWPPVRHRRWHPTRAEPDFLLNAVAFEGANVAECGDLEVEPAAVDPFKSGDGEAKVGNAIHDTDVMLSLERWQQGVFDVKGRRAVRQEIPSGVEPSAVKI